MHTSSTLVLVLAVFGASLVEMVEALTLVVAAGVSRGWRSALEGAAAAVLVLGVLVLAVGVPLIRYMPIDALRVVVGALLLVLGLNWLRKAVLRSSGHKAMHDEDAIYAETVAELSEETPTDSGRPSKGRDPVGFAVAFKGVFLEGLEVAFIVIAFGDTHHNLALGAIAAGAALVTVVILGVVVHGPLSRVPENALKFAVGLMLVAYGTFWGGESVGVDWPGGDLAILGLIAFYALTAACLVAVRKRQTTSLASA